MRGLDTLAWPVSRLGEAIEVLAHKSGLSPQSVELPSPPQGLAQDGGEPLNRWIASAAGSLGLEAEPVTVPYAEIKWLVQHAGPHRSQLKR